MVAPQVAGNGPEQLRESLGATLSVLSSQLTAAQGTHDAGASGTLIGPEVGAGVEYAVTDKVSLTPEVRFYQLSKLQGSGDNNDLGYGPPDPCTATYTPRGTIFEAGLNVHF